MCTIGVVFHNDQILTFKQCDLIPETTFHEPEKRSGKNGVGTYIAMTRKGSKGIWAGVNDAGVAFVAADSYTTKAAGYYADDSQFDKLFEAYEAIIRDHTSAKKAADSLCNFYKEVRQEKGNSIPFPAPDIAMVTGWKDSDKTQPIAIFIEYMPNPYNQDSIRKIERTDGYFASTNNFRLQPNSVNYPANHSTYLRLQRAETILQSDPTKNGIETLLKDQYYGETELSICRETKYENKEFRTQATALFTVNKETQACDYQINGNPKNQPLETFSWS